jgi:hypothetical protein
MTYTSEKKITLRSEYLKESDQLKDLDIEGNDTKK